MIVTAPLFQAYLECPTKCWLRLHAESATGNVYAEWVRAQNDLYRLDALNRLRALFATREQTTAPSITKQSKGATWGLATDVKLNVNGLESHLQAVEKMPAAGDRRTVRFIPYHFHFANAVAKNEKLLLAFDAMLLSELLECRVSLGKILHGDRHVIVKVQLSSLMKEVRRRIKTVNALLANTSPPDFALNRHCPQCEFQLRCRKEAVERDELTLLSGMTEKQRKKLHERGIFTVTQLSFTFRPRRRSWARRGKKEKFHQSLRARAIRENKIHTVDLVDPKLDGTPVYLDVEGMPDRDVYYLIGARVVTAHGPAQHQFWANDAAEEKHIWQELVDLLATIPDPQIIHYGSYEKDFLKRMQDRYGAPPQASTTGMAIQRGVNLLSLIFAQIYFPTYSNGLKEIGRYLGFHWPEGVGSGLESIVWRSRWEVSRDPEEKQRLLDYNRLDCEALERVTGALLNLVRDAPSEGRLPQHDVVRASDIRREGLYKFKRNAFVIPDLEVINRAAYWDYQRERVYVKSSHKAKGRSRRKANRRSVVTLRPNTTIEYPRPRRCSQCKSKAVVRHTCKTKRVIDLRFMRHGLKRWVTRHVLRRYLCKSCGKAFAGHPLFLHKYGSGLTAYMMYMNIELRLPHGHVDNHVERVFGLHMAPGSAKRCKTTMALSYRPIYDNLVKKLCSGPLLNVDETGISVRGHGGFVWVLASAEDVAYVYTPTREGTTIQGLLKDFTGVLVSDFYTAYDSIPCIQQKCLIHFIRDLNEALLKYPYDEELKRLGTAFADLVKPIVDTVDRRGLKKRFLRKHKAFVSRFYRHIDEASWTSDAGGKLVTRLQKNRNKMFTFLDFDGVPWNNNNAEHAVKAFATLRQVIDGPTSENGLLEYLILLSLCETCKYKRVDFLDFLRSGSENIDEFAVSQRRRGLNMSRSWKMDG
jgi:predicted RecB family nuclease